MYIGPWQEFKLARILQLKDKVEQEEQQENSMGMQGEYSRQQTGKAYSVNTRIGGSPQNMADSYSNMSGVSHPVRLQQLPSDSGSLARAKMN